MSDHRNCFAFALLFLTLAASAPAQTPREQRNPVEAYLEVKQREFASSERAANARALGQHVTALYNLLRDKGAMRNANVIGRSGDEQAQVRDARNAKEEDRTAR